MPREFVTAVEGGRPGVAGGCTGTTVAAVAEAAAAEEAKAAAGVAVPVVVVGQEHSVCPSSVLIEVVCVHDRDQ